MKEKFNTYRLFKLNSNLGIPFFGFSILLFFFIYLFTILNSKPNSEIFLYCIFGIIIFLTIIFLVGFARKIDLYDDRIEFIGLKNRNRLEFKNVKSYGVYLLTSLGPQLIDENKIENFSIWGTKMIYLCKNEFPNFGNKISDGYIIFQYRKSAYDFIKDKINVG